MKKVLSIVLSLVMIFSTLAIAPFSAFAETSGDLGATVSYSLDSETGVLTVTGTGATNNYSSSPISSTIRSATTKIVIGEGITQIGDYAFDHFTNVTDIEFPSTLTSIGFYSFGYCSSIEELTFPDSVTTLGRASFGYSLSLKSVTIGKGMNNVSSSAFNTKSLLSFTVDPENQYYSTVDGNLYNANKTQLIKYCSGKSEATFTVPENVTSIASYAFSSCEAGVSPLTTIVLPSTLKELKSECFRGFSSLEELTIPDGLETIGYGAFMYCDSLHEIILPSSVKSIGNRAFEGCDFTSLNIPSSVISIGPEAFFNLLKCTEFTVDAQNKMFKAVDGAVYSKNSETLYTYPTARTNTSFTVLDGTKDICNYAFYRAKFSNITLPASIERIGEYAFYKSEVTSITIPKNIKTIDRGAFQDTYSLTDITIENPYAVISSDDGSLGYIYSPSQITYHSYEKCDGTDSTAKAWIDDHMSNYSKVPVYVSLGAAAHEYATPVSNDDGTHTATCKNCGDAQTVACTITSSPQVDATCVEDGHTAGEICTECNYLKTAEIIPATGSHDFSFVDADIISEPSCSSTGLRTAYYECNNCSTPKKVNEEISKLPHTLVTQSAVEPTCTEDGLTEGLACSVCGAVSVTQLKVIATGHSYDVTSTTAPTCVEKGYTTYTCSKCFDVYNDDFVPALGHSYTVVKAAQINPTCGKAGKKAVKKCANCDETIGGEAIPATGKHTYKVVLTKKPTSKATGVLTYTCSGCGAKYTKSVAKVATAKLGKLASKKKAQLTVKWTKKSCTGYQVQVATDSKFKKNVKNSTITKAATVSKTMTKLKAGKKYYVRIRCYKTVNGTKCYGSWTKAKTITTKK